MRANTPPGQGSFGIPQHVTEAAERAKKEAAEKTRREQEDAAPSEPASGVPSASQEGVDDILKKDLDPVEALKKLGITLTEDDFHGVLFKGYVEKVVTVFPELKSKEALTATIRTLTVEDYDLADELLSEELDKLKVTNDGYHNRRSAWWLSFALIRLNNRPITKEVRDSNGALDLKATAMKRREVIRKTAPAVMSKIQKLYSALTIAINSIVDNPSDDTLKKL